MNSIPLKCQSDVRHPRKHFLLFILFAVLAAPCIAAATDVLNLYNWTVNSP